MKSYLYLIDTDTSGNRNDVTPIFSHPEAFKQMISDLYTPFLDSEIDLIAGIDALGFILGSALAQHTGKGFLPIRKEGKLPVETDSVQFTDYSGEIKRLEIRKDMLLQNSRILIVDEWIETGTQVKAAISLLENRGAIVIGISTINIDINKNTSDLLKRYMVHSLQ